MLEWLYEKVLYHQYKVLGKSKVKTMDCYVKIV